MKTLPPEKWLLYCQKIHRSEKQAQCPKERGFCKMTKGIVDKFWVIIENNLSEGNYLNEIRCECDHMEKLTRDIQECKKIDPKHEEMLQKHGQKIQTAIKLVEDSRQGKEDQPFQSFMDALYSVVKDISKLTGKESEKDVQEKCQNVLQSLQAVKDKAYSPHWIKPFKPDFDRKFKARVNQFWDIIQSNISEGKRLFVIGDQCYHMDKLMGIIRKNTREIFPQELRKHIETLRVCTAKAWEVIEDKQTEKELREQYNHNLEDSIIDHRDAFECVSKLTMKWFPEEYPVHCHNILQSLQSRMSVQASECYKNHVNEISKDMLKKLMETIRLLADRRQDPIQPNLNKLSEEEIKEQEDKVRRALLNTWSVIVISISVAKLSEMRDQCNNIKELNELITEKFAEMFPDELCMHKEKLHLSIAKAWEVIEDKQTEDKLTTEGKRMDKYYTNDAQSLKDGIKDLRDAFECVTELTTKFSPKEFPFHCHNILQSQQSAISEQSSYCYKHHLDEMFKDIWKKLMEIIPLLANRHKNTIKMNVNKISPQEIKEQEDNIRAALLEIWNVIEINISVGKLSKMKDQCNYTKELNELIHENFGEIFPEKLCKHKEKFQLSIVKAREVIEDKQTEEKLIMEGKQVDKNKGKSQALEDGIKDLRDAFKCVSELTMKFSPEEFPNHCQSILQSQQSAITEQSSERYKRHLDQMSKDMVKKLMETIPLSTDTHKYTSQEEIKDRQDKIRGILLQFWNVIEISISVAKLSEMRDQCNNIKELNELVCQKFVEIFPEELYKHKEKLQLSIVKAWKVIEDKQTEEKLTAEGKMHKHHSKDHQVLEDGIKDLRDAFECVSELTMKFSPEEFPKHCQSIL